MMTDGLDRLLNEYDRGVLSRRQLVQALLLAMTASQAGAQSRTTGLVPARSINHLQFTVKDLKQSQEFYSRVLGATIRDTSPSIWTLTLPGTGSWLSLMQRPDRPGVLDHVGIGVDLQNPERIRADLKQAFPNSNVMSPGSPKSETYDRSVYIDDPNGLRIQLIAKDDDGHLPNSAKKP